MKEMLLHSPYPYNDQSTCMAYRWSPGCIMWDNSIFSLCGLWFLEWMVHFCCIKVLYYVFCGDLMDPLCGLSRLCCDNEWTGSCSHITTHRELSLLSSMCNCGSSFRLDVQKLGGPILKQLVCKERHICILTQVLLNVASTLYGPGDLGVQLLFSICHPASAWTYAYARFQGQNYSTARNFLLCCAQGLLGGLPWFAG